MKKSLKHAFLAAVLLTALTSVLSAKSNPSVKTEVVSVDKHGNVNLAITGTLFAALGFGLGDFVTVKAGTEKFIAPVGKNYSDVDRGNYFLRIKGEELSLAINMGNFAEKTGVTVGSPVTITQKERLGFLRTYQTRLLTKSKERADFASDEVFANFRAVKAGRIAEGRLYRSTNPLEADERAPFAASLAEKAGIACALDLADSEETARARLSSVPFYAALFESGNAQFYEMSASFTDKKTVALLHEALSFLASHSGPYYIHGKEGRTRTGMLCMLLEALCGATIDEMDDDYMATYVNYYNVRPETVQYGALVQAVPDFFRELNGGKDVSDANVQAVAEKYLLKTVKLTEEQVEALRRNLQA